MMMTLDDRNIQINILEINRESTMTLLHELPYLFDSWYLKIRYVHVAIELLKIKYGA